MSNFTRRSTLGLLGGSAAIAGLGAPVAAFQGAKLPQMTLAGPPAPPTIYLAHMADGMKAMDALADKTTFQQWRSPDMLISMVMKGQVHCAATPSNTAAILFNKGADIKLLDITTWGVLHLLTRRNDIKGLPDLKGKSLLSFFRGGMPDIVTQFLAGKQGLDLKSDVKLSYATTPMEGLQLFMAGRAETVILPEPAVTAARIQSKMVGKPLNSIDLQDVWTEVTGRGRVPQAGTLVQARLVDERPDLVAALKNNIKASVDWMVNDKDAAAKLGAREFNLPAPMVRKALDNVHMERVSAVDAREELEYFYEALAGLSPKLIGGKLPDASFYLA